MQKIEAFAAIAKERDRQDVLHPHNEEKEMLAILIEEVGEIARALQGEGDLTEEIIHAAAVCVRWLEMREE